MELGTPTVEALALPGMGPPPPEPVTAAQDVFGALHEVYGFDRFRPGQEEAVRAALADRDVLVVMPTGSGKSLCYQLPALMRSDLTLVVSPLVSLMQDQVQALERRVPGRVALVNAQQDAATNRRVVQDAVEGRVRVLYVAPERFSSPGFLEQIRHADVGLFVVDEAHCVSQWGHDFRPDYFRLADAARWLGASSIVASTATATPQVATDIVTRLGLLEPVRVSTGFDRPNLSFAVVPCSTKEAVARGISATLQEDGALPAIVYAGTRAECDRLAERLTRDLGQEVVAYHAGLPRDARARTQERFMEGDVQVVVATNAFGMGVDKADVRTVCHESVPGSLEAYYQEAGRAGRDGKQSRALVFACNKDKGLHVFFIERSTVDDTALTRVAQRIMLRAAESRYDVQVDELARTAGCEEEAVRAIIGYLARAGVVQPSPSSPDRALGRIVGRWDARALAACRSNAQDGTRARWKQFRTVWAWVEGNRCRRDGMLAHFGDPAKGAPTGPCCDVCDSSLRPAVPPPSRRAAAASARVGDAARARRGAAVGSGEVPVRSVRDEGDTTGLDDAILDVVATAEPPVGRTRAVEVLRGGRSAVVVKHSYDGLVGYGTFSHLSSGEVLGRVDELIDAGTLRSTGGRFPKLEVV